MKTTKTDQYYIGIDICKAKLDVHCHAWRSIKTFNNDSKGIKSLISALNKTKDVDSFHIVCEATGGYEKLLAKTAFDLDLRISVVNPRQVRDLAKASGQLAKTDSIDAKVITFFGETFHPKPSTPPSQEQITLEALVKRRVFLVNQRAKELTILQQTTEPIIKKDIKAGIKNLTIRIERFEVLIAKVIKENEDMKAKSKRLQEASGVGPVLSSTLIAILPELGTITNKQASALVGLAPFNKDSGTMKGKRAIRGGRSLVRKALYMPTLSAINSNPIFSEIYNRLTDKGKPHHVAMVAVMRKLICLVNRMLSNPDFQLKKIN